MESTRTNLLQDPAVKGWWATVDITVSGEEKSGESARWPGGNGEQSVRLSAI